MLSCGYEIISLGQELIYSTLFIRVIPITQNECSENQGQPREASSMQEYFVIILVKIFGGTDE